MTLKQKNKKGTEKIDKLDFIEIKNVYVSEDIIKKMKRQLTEKENTIAYI